MKIFHVTNTCLRYYVLATNKDEVLDLLNGKIDNSWHIFDCELETVNLNCVVVRGEPDNEYIDLKEYIDRYLSYKKEPIVVASNELRLTSKFETEQFLARYNSYEEKRYEFNIIHDDGLEPEDLE